jgi:uncharacterized protein YvpB
MALLLRRPRLRLRGQRRAGEPPVRCHHGAMSRHTAGVLVTAMVAAACWGCAGGGQAAAGRPASARSSSPPSAPASPAAAPPTPTPAAAPPPPTARVLPIAEHHQERRATCEVAALLMALAGEGIVTSESDLLAVTGVDRTPPRVQAGALVAWGDPYVAFVGDPDGSPTEHTGYGVYAPPIARAAAAVGGRVGRSGTGIAPSDLYAAVIAGHASVAWVSNTYSRVDLGSWTAFDGRAVPYSLHEHAVAVIGVDGGRVLLDDPWFGQSWHAKAEFEAAYATFDDMAVVLT